MSSMGRAKITLIATSCFMIEDLSGEPVGYFQHPNCIGRTGVSAIWYELKPDVSWLAVTPAVVRHLWARDRNTPDVMESPARPLGLFMGAEHPAYEALGKDLPSVHLPYAWYMRSP